MSSFVEVINDRDVSTGPGGEPIVVLSPDDVEVIVTGEQGPPGPPGPGSTVPGPPGPPGVAGNTILYGETNPTGSDGVDGDFYINTATHAMFGPKVSGSWGPGFLLIGPAGPAGEPGNTILYGAANPTAGIGVNGNFYINTTTNFFFGPKAAGAWPAGVSLVGPVGPAGGIEEAPIDGEQYARKDGGWEIVVGGGGGGTTVLVSDTAPVGVPDNTLWWESDGGNLYILYNDGTSTQWVPTTLFDVLTQMSIAEDAGGLKLSGDVAAPGASKTYGTDAAGVRGWKPDPVSGRTLLTADRTYYVATAAGGGNDSNNGLTAGTPFLTIQKALDVLAATLDIAGKNITIQVADGTYTGTNLLRNVPGYAAAGNLTIQGNLTTPANCIISTTSAACFYGSGLSVTWDIKGFKLQTTTAGIGLRAEGGSKIRFDKINFGACVQFHMLSSGAGSEIRIYDSFTYSITGGAGAHAYSTMHGVIMPFFAAITVTGTLNFSQAFAQCDLASVQQWTSAAINIAGATVTGVRYIVASQGMFTGIGALPNYFPGNAAGTNDGTGLYG